MGSYRALVVRHESDTAVVADTLANLAKAGLVERTEPRRAAGALRVQVELPDSVFEDIDGTEKQLQKVTKKFGLHLVLVMAASASDSFLYVHWYAGKIVRSLGCSIEEDGMWTRVSGEAESWEAEAFEGEEVTNSQGKSRALGRADDGSISSPRRGDISIPPDAMKYAEHALEAW